MTFTDRGNDAPAAPAPDKPAPAQYDPTRFRDVFEQSYTYANGFARNTHRFATRPALRDPATDRSWTYAELSDAVDRVGGWLVRHGVGSGAIVMAELFNSPEFAILYLACHRIGAVFSPTNFRLAPAEVAYIIDDSAPTVLVYDLARSVEIAEALETATHRPGAVVAVGAPSTEASTSAGASTSTGTGTGTGTVSFTDLLEAPPVTPLELEERPARDTYAETTRLYTSGTTGRPKPVPLPSLVEVLSAHDVIMHFPLTPFDKTLNMSPLFHRGGLYSGGPNPVFYVGAELTTLRHFDADVALDLVESERLTFLIGAPTNLVQLADAQERNPRDLSSLHGIVTMGAPLDRAAALRFQRLLTPRIFNGYGTTETFWNTFLRPEDFPDGAGSTGRASTDDDVAVVQVYTDRLADPTDTVAKDGTEIGEFAVRTVKSGYSYRNPELEAEKFSDGWFYPGDLATWDEHERVTIVGRKDDMIISGGENVHPVQVEAVLGEHDGVADSVVVGVPDERWGEIVTAYVIRKATGLPDDDADAAAELERFTGSHPGLARYKRPRLYRFVDSIPYNATGKKVHYLAKATAAEDHASGLLLAP
jgi:acyl-CoA synthetase (AMP-forming)/AMP-acid ligase II